MTNTNFSRWSPTSLVFILFATLGAVLMVPRDVSVVGATFYPAVILSLGLLFPVAIQVRRDLRKTLRVENVLYVGIIYWILLDLLQSAYPLRGIERSDVQSAFGCIGLFAASLSVGSLGRGWRLPGAVRASASVALSNSTISILIITCFIFGVADYLVSTGFDLPLILDSLGGARWSTPWEANSGGLLGSILDHLQYFGLVVPALATILIVRKGLFSAMSLLSVLLALVILIFVMQSGSRRVIGAVIGAAVFTWIIYRPLLKAGTIVAVATAAAATLFLMQKIVEYRKVGLSRWLQGEPAPGQALEHLHVDDNFYRLTQTIRLFPEQVDFVGFGPIYHALTLPIPRALWSGKPDGPGYDLARLVGEQGVSFSSSIVGELWASYGWTAVLFGGLVFGRLAAMWNRLLVEPRSASNAFLYGAGLMALFVGLRSMQAATQLSYVIVAWLALSTVAGKPRVGNSSRFRSDHLTMRKNQVKSS